MGEKRPLPLRPDPWNGVQNGSQRPFSPTVAMKGNDVAVGFIPDPLQKIVHRFILTQVDRVGASRKINLIPGFPGRFSSFLAIPMR